VLLGEAVIVMALKQVNELVGHNVFQALDRLFDEPKV
jgi:hypothetical protein